MMEMKDSHKGSELERLWAALRADPSNLLMIVPYVAGLVIALFELHLGLEILFYAVIVPMYTGYALGYIVIWYPKRHREDAYVWFATASIIFNVLLLSLLTGGIHRVQVIVLVAFFLIGLYWERRNSR